MGPSNSLKNQTFCTESLRVEIFDLEQRLILSYNPLEIRETLIRLDGMNSTKPLWKVNGSWELPIPLQSVVMSLPRGFLQDYSYILLAKSRELALGKDFDRSKELLTVLESEVQHHIGNLTFKLCRLISWEILLVEIWQCLHHWPGTNFCKLFIIFCFLLYLKELKKSILNYKN